MVRQPPSCLGTNPRPEERNEGSGGLSNGPKNLPSLHSSAMVASRIVGCWYAEWRFLLQWLNCGPV